MLDRRPLVVGLALLLTACQPAAPPAPTPTASAVPAKPTSLPPTPTPPPVGSKRVDALNAANDAFRSGDLERAADLYDRVLNTPPIGESDATRSAIDDLAAFRAIVALLGAGREDDGRAHLDSLRTRDADAPLARLANQLWDQYSMTGQLRGACAQLQPQIASQAAGQVSTLQGLGVTVDGNTLCTVPQG